MPGPVHARVHAPSGEAVTAGMECMPGSAIYLMGTGMSHSQSSIFLSSEVEAKRRPSS